MLRSLLVAVDLSAISDRVIARVAQLPLAADARITLLHVVSNGLPAHARRSAARDANKVLRDQVASLAEALPSTVEIGHRVEVGAPAAEVIACARSVRAKLVVMGRGGGRAIRDIFLGSTAERVVRQTKLPVLVVRLRPRSRYRRPVLAVDLDRVAHDVLGALLRMVPSPRPAVTVIHAYNVPYEGLVYPSLTMDDAAESREYYRDKARRELSKLLASSLDEHGVAAKDIPAFAIHAEAGSARSVVEKTVKKVDADLVVLGTHGYAGLAYAFLGTVAGDVLRHVACDVLVVPPRESA